MPVAGRLRVAGLDFQLYGVCDYVKAGVIYDIKRVQRYEYGKYLHSPQHPMYLHLLPGASKFTYLIFDDANTYAETYRRGDFEPIEDTISHFINWLLANGHINNYFTHWEMNTDDADKIGKYANALGIEPGTDFELDDLVGRNCILHMEPFEGDDGVTRDCIRYLKPSKAESFVTAAPSSSEDFKQLDESDDDLPF